MVRVACTLMQKNERALLRPWLEYHGHLFGMSNIFLFDNGSTEPNVLQLLNEYEARAL